MQTSYGNVGSPYGAYGGRMTGEGGVKILSSVRGQRRRVNIYAICMSLFVPWLMFTLLSALFSFQTHYSSPGLCYVGAGFAILVVFGFGLCGFVAVRARAAGDSSREPTWLVFIFVTSFVAWVLALMLGNNNFWHNMQPFFDVLNLSTYPSVNTAQTRGQQLMDAGRIIFTPGTHLDTSKAMGFKNLDTYCVAPITSVDSPVSSYDYWAVGRNCCNGQAADFHCGDYTNPNARAGLRLMSDDDRAFYRLAVQQAESTFNIRAVHPLFFHFVQDPDAELYSHQGDGYRTFLLGMFGHFAFQLSLVVLAVWCFTGMS